MRECKKKRWKKIRNGEMVQLVSIEIEWILKTIDTGSQYHCGRVGRGIQPPSTPSPTLQAYIHSHTLTHIDNFNGSLKNALFCMVQLNHHGWTNRPTDWRTDAQSLIWSCVSANENNNGWRPCLFFPRTSLKGRYLGSEIATIFSRLNR